MQTPFEYILAIEYVFNDTGVGKKVVQSPSSRVAGPKRPLTLNRAGGLVLCPAPVYTQNG